MQEEYIVNYGRYKTFYFVAPRIIVQAESMEQAYDMAWGQLTSDHAEEIRIHDKEHPEEALFRITGVRINRLGGPSWGRDNIEKKQKGMWIYD